jgi:hypothetical protein
MIINDKVLILLRPRTAIVPSKARKYIASARINFFSFLYRDPVIRMRDGIRLGIRECEREIKRDKESVC